MDALFPCVLGNVRGSASELLSLNCCKAFLFPSVASLRNKIREFTNLHLLYLLISFSIMIAYLIVYLYTCNNQLSV